VKRILALVVAMLCLVIPAVSSAATFTVNTTADGPVTGTCAAGETCTLREALTAAGLQTTDPTDTVIVPAGRYVLTAGELVLTAGTTAVVGSGARSTVIDAVGALRVFDVAGGIAEFEDLTVSGGAATGALAETMPGDGGGILFAEAAEGGALRRVTVSGNTATLNGGGVAAPPETTTGKVLAVEGSTISGNRVSGGAVEALGGGLYVLGELTMVNSTVTGNVAESPVGLQEGGGILAGPAAQELATTSTTIVNSTIAGNSVGVGGTGGGLAIYNPGGLIEPTSTLTNTILAGNKVGEAESNCGPLTITSKNDLSGDASCTFTDTASKRETDPRLGPLADNGGETDTLALLAGSPAIDAGTSEGCPVLDQRGVARPIGTACDIGAYEYQPTPPNPGGSGGTGGTGGSGGGATGQTTEIADLKLAIKAQPKKPKRGKKLAFKVTVTNAGPSVAHAVVFKGTVPAATKKVKVKGLGLKACKLVKAKKGKGKGKKGKKKKPTLTCALGDLASGSSLSFAIGVKTKKGPRKLAVSGAVTSSVPDPTPADAKAKVVAKLKR
jgi:CSLREA domain-containing protein/uncharacterized repeat protein (TIGR01451 family)